MLIPDSDTMEGAFNTLIKARKRAVESSFSARERALIEGDDEALPEEGVSSFDEEETPSNTLLESGGASLTPTGI